MTENKLWEYARGLKILYVEDDQNARESTVELLNCYFGNIVTAVDGVDGIEKFDNEIDLIISDINMPKKNGIEMLKEIKEKNKTISTIVISAHNDTEYFVQTIDIGIDGYMLKPISIKNFMMVLLKVIEKIFYKKEIENYKKELEQKVSNQIKELQQKDNQLAQQSKLAAMGEIMDIVAHQWKQPLNLISLKTSFLAEFVDDDYIPASDVIKCNKDVMNNINHLVNTLNEFRKFFRPNSNIFTCDILSSIQSVEILLKDDLIKNNIELDIVCNDKIELNINENELKHIFINLINNAKDAFKDNNIENRKIKIDVFKENHIVILISDNAGGIPSDIIDNIFKANYTTKQNHGGTGIGLYMSEMIAHKYNMSLTVENINNGAMFRLEQTN